MTRCPFGDRVGTTRVADMTGIPLFLAAALEDCRTLPQAQALKDAVTPLVPSLATQGPAREADQAVVDAVCSVMGRAWRPAPRWRDRLRDIGRYDLASW